jgi:transposase
MGVENAAIKMDNAKYHKCLPQGTPRGSWKKDHMQESLTKYNIPWEPNEIKPTLQYKLMKYVRENIEPEVFQMAKAAGHEILYSPPNLSYLSPIETVWANIKGDIGREYTDETAMKDVEERLLRAFNNVKSKQVAGVIKKTNGHIYELLI